MFYYQGARVTRIIKMCQNIIKFCQNYKSISHVMISFLRFRILRLICRPLTKLHFLVYYTKNILFTHCKCHSIYCPKILFQTRWYNQ